MSKSERGNPYNLAVYILEYKRFERSELSKEAIDTFAPFLQFLRLRYGDRVFTSPLLCESNVFTLPAVIQKTERKMFGSIQCNLRFNFRFDGRTISIETQCAYARERESKLGVILSSKRTTAVSIADAHFLEKFEKSFNAQASSFQDEINHKEVLTFRWTKGFPVWD